MPFTSLRKQVEIYPSAMTRQVEISRLRLLWAAFFVAVAATIFEIVSLFCDSWVSGTIHYINSTTTYHYGLFYGEQTIQRHEEGHTISTTHGLQFCCSSEEAVCMVYSPDIITGNCITNFNNFISSYPYPDIHKNFLPNGLWKSTLAFVPLAALGGILAAVFTILDLLCLLSHSRLKLFALIANIFAAIVTLLSLSLGAATTNYIPFVQYVFALYTLDRVETTASSIEYGYWFLLAGIVLYCVNVGLFAVLRKGDKAGNGYVV